MGGQLHQLSFRRVVYQVKDQVLIIDKIKRDRRELFCSRGCSQGSTVDYDGMIPENFFIEIFIGQPAAFRRTRDRNGDDSQIIKGKNNSFGSTSGTKNKGLFVMGTKEWFNSLRKTNVIGVEPLKFSIVKYFYSINRSNSFCNRENLIQKR